MCYRYLQNLCITRPLSIKMSDLALTIAFAVVSLIVQP